MVNLANFYGVCITVDRYADWIPLVSTGTNLINLFLKAIAFMCTNESSFKNNVYIVHLQEKSLWRCIFLLLPIVGQCADYIIKTDLKLLSVKRDLEQIQHWLDLAMQQDQQIEQLNQRIQQKLQQILQEFPILQQQGPFLLGEQLEHIHIQEHQQNKHEYQHKIEQATLQYTHQKQQADFHYQQHLLARPGIWEKSAFRMQRDLQKTQSFHQWLTLLVQVKQQYLVCLQQKVQQMQQEALLRKVPQAFIAG